MNEEMLKPAEAAVRLGMPASTLRVYSTKFAELLSESASNPPVSPDGRTGHRVYDSRDLGILTKAKEVLARGLTYEQALVELRAIFPSTRSKAWIPAGGGNSGITVTNTASLVQKLEEALTQLSTGAQAAQKAAESWQEIALERKRENEELRARLNQLELKMERLEDRWERMVARDEEEEEMVPRVEEETIKQTGLWSRFLGR